MGFDGGGAKAKTHKRVIWGRGRVLYVKVAGNGKVSVAVRGKTKARLLEACAHNNSNRDLDLVFA